MLERAFYNFWFFSGEDGGIQEDEELNRCLLGSLRWACTLSRQNLYMVLCVVLTWNGGDSLRGWDISDSTKCHSEAWNYQAALALLVNWWQTWMSVSLKVLVSSCKFRDVRGIYMMLPNSNYVHVVSIYSQTESNLTNPEVQEVQEWKATQAR